MGIGSTLRLRLLALFAIGLGAVAPALGQTRTVTLAWDPNPEPFVTGYIVYVGNAPGRYDEEYDVGGETSFVYTEAIPGRPYYFAVAAYASGERVGPRSEEVFFLGRPYAETLAPSLLSGSGAPLGGHDTLCPGTDRTGCYSAEVLASIAGEVTSLALTGDGRLFFIENGAFVRVLGGDGLLAQPALSRDSASTRLAGVVLDPDFMRNRFAYVAELATRADGTRELNVVRYRELVGVFGEPAVVVPSLPMATEGDPVLAIDSGRRLYVALPSGSVGDPHGAAVLRFEHDGSVPRNSRAGSPLFARGYAEPYSLTWDAARAELWLSGNGAAWVQAPVAHLPTADGSSEWPRVPTSTPIPISGAVSATSGDRDVVLVDRSSGLLRIGSTPEGTPTAELISVDDLGGEPTSAAQYGGAIYSSIVAARPDAPPMSQIVRLRRK
jgi:hypothetical protein